MKHSVKITLLLLSMFFVSQLIGLLVITAYAPVIDSNGTAIYDLPYGFNPPTEMNPSSVLFSIIVPLAIAIILMYMLMKFRIESILRGWFFVVIILALGITLYALFRIWISNITALYLVTTILAFVLAYIKVFKRNMFVHNATELLIYPGIAAIFASLFTFSDSTLSSSSFFGPIYATFGFSASTWSIITISILLILISLYDMYAVWKAGFMQKMAKYQMNTLKIFGGFIVPYLSNKDRDLVNKARLSKTSSKLNTKKIKVNIAILGGGDIVFPMILAGVVLQTLGVLPALIIALGATLSLAYLFYISEKGKFYPAMPFITIGCFLALIIAWII